MAVRPIDADRLKQAIEHDYYEHYTKYHDSDQTALIDMVMDDIEEMPTLTPPNEPLTPCDVCKFSPPSSSDGKPCCMCPAERRPPEGDCEIKDYAENCEECRFCDNTPASPPEGEEDTIAKTLTQNGKAREHIVKLWTAQLCLDVMADVLNDPAVMGRDALGAKRLQRVEDAFNRQFPEFLRALSKDPEADYIRAKVDEQQRRIFGPQALSWAERYTYWTEDKYL